MLSLKGIAIGTANAVPGVSGGTIAVITKIYDKLLAAITPNIKKLIKNLPFLIPVGLGMLIGILAAAKVLGFLFDEFNVPTQMFFIGVVIGSIPMIYKECTAEKSAEYDRFARALHHQLLSEEDYPVLPACMSVYHHVP